MGPASCFIIPRDIFWFVHHRAKSPPWQGTGQVGVGHALSGRLSAVYVLAKGYGDPAACYQKRLASGLSEYASGIWTQGIRTQMHLMHVLVKWPPGRAQEGPEGPKMHLREIKDDVGNENGEKLENDVLLNENARF